MLYGALMQVAPSPVIELNRGVAVGMAEGPTAGLAVVTPLLNDKTLQRYPWLWAVHGDLLERLGRHAEARSAFERAASLAGNDQDRHTLLRRVSNASRD